MASDNYMFRRIMVAIIRLCSFKGKLNTIASSYFAHQEAQLDARLTRYPQTS